MERLDTRKILWRILMIRDGFKVRSVGGRRGVWDCDSFLAKSHSFLRDNFIEMWRSHDGFDGKFVSCKINFCTLSKDLLGVTRGWRNDIIPLLLIFLT
jgi:hypothetical protein